MAGLRWGGSSQAPGGEEAGQPKARGLPSIQQAREERASGKSRWPSTKFWAYVLLVLAVTLILQWKWSSGDVERTKQKLLADQRGVAAALGPRWYPLRERMESWTMDLAKSAGPEVIDKAALTKWDFRERSGIYLRLRVEEAGSAEDIRKGALGSLRDGFTSCLMRVKNPSATDGAPCKRSRDCPASEFCNEQDHCSRPSQPFNLRVAYRTMRILSDEWVREVQQADSELRMRLYTTSFEDAKQDDLRLATDLLTQAQYFLLVLDETPPGTTAPAGGSMDEAVQGVPHFARVAVWRIGDDKPILRVRRDASGELIGASPEVEADVLGARARQANSCALALAVRDAMGDASAAGVPPAK
jgi:hypothetical protein